MCFGCLSLALLKHTQPAFRCQVISVTGGSTSHVEIGKSSSRVRFDLRADLRYTTQGIGISLLLPAVGPRVPYGPDPVDSDHQRRYNLRQSARR